MSNQVHNPEMDDRLAVAACAAHPYTPSCGYCVHRYFVHLMEKDYVSRWLNDQLRRELHAARAMVASLQVSIDYEKSQVEHWKAAAIFHGPDPQDHAAADGTQ